MEKVNLTIDDRQVETDAGTTVLEAALAAGIYVPHLCHHPDLDPVGVCRLCMVDIGGRMAVGCKTPVANGMVVRTETPQVDSIRRITVELLIASHPQDCLACSQNDQCELQRVASYVGVDRQRLSRMRRPAQTAAVDSSNPFFDYDRDKCVLCGICVRTCDQLQGVCAIDFTARGYQASIGTFAGKPLTESCCESCGECVVRCPVGALALKNTRQPSREVKTVCPYCGVGCSVYLGVRGGKIVSSRGDRESPVNKGSLCVKGRFGQDYVNSPKRLTKPLIRKNGQLEEATWDEALDLVATKFSRHKGSQFATIASAKCTNEENYLVQKFTRAAMATHSIDHCARL